MEKTKTMKLKKSEMLNIQMLIDKGIKDMTASKRFMLIPEGQQENLLDYWYMLSMKFNIR